ncbi:AI-2E family transporter [Rhodoplanes sp. Z2-YC6860]|uniref:AI-2E family transporter n=1 Tax=Rhodoplanes sp. Z2-YC6860 TaxID=674703 RepID=UPI00082D7CDB|nr:AI-2E family transporter [Rhodoplanes sp. Z2-YC6860]
MNDREADTWPATSDAPEQDWWRAASRISTIGIFVLLLGAFLFFARTIVAPVVAAAIISLMFGPLQERAARYRIPASLFALVCIGLVFVAINLGLILLGSLVADWSAHAPEIASTLSAKAYVFERPLAAWHQLQQWLATMLGTSAEPAKFELPMKDMIARAVEFLTPAIGELVIFFGSLFFFLLSRKSQRRHLILMFQSKDARLRALRIFNDMEEHLTRYIAVVTVVNIGLGLATAAIAYTLGLPSPLLCGIMAAVLNYIPYIGPAVVAVILLVLGLVALPTLTGALAAPALFVGLATVEGHFITPSLVGRQLTMSPLALFLSLAFWTWLWGPLGTFLAAPILIAATVVQNQILEDRESTPKLPG